MLPPHGGRLINRVLEGEKKKKARTKARELLRIELRDSLAQDVENIGKGVFSPLEGFLSEEDFQNVLYKKRLVCDLPWTMPIVLDVNKDIAAQVKDGDDLALFYEDEPLAILHLEQKYRYNKGEFQKQVFGTIDRGHPGVRKVEEMDDVLLAGKIDLIGELKNPFFKYNLSPIETRTLFKEKGWRTIVGFQTRNVPHLGHEYVQKAALTFVDGLFINPVIGKKKAGDFKDEVILKTYEELMKSYYLQERVVMSILNFEMRYAGPREAILHAIMRKNFGCTHFIVGRDHAGVGNYYPPYAAQEIFDEFPDLGITPLCFKSFFYCKKCGGVVNEKICPHDEANHINFSGTKIRELLIEGKTPPQEIMRREIAEIIVNYKNPFVE
ncbi:MAG TPA: sulfate adenylyltransferase [bacterium (Candidatus Stahlbacteria)]|nr:sulfate adenylyltransferase [Candidatus Stahlbacteria bacterium]